MRKVILEVDEKRVILEVDENRVILEDVVGEWSNSHTRITKKIYQFLASKIVILDYFSRELPF